MSVAIGNLGTIPSLTVGGVVFTDLSAALIVLYGSVATTTRYTTLRRTTATAGYQTTSGKTLTIRACKITYISLTGNPTINLLYGDTDVGLNSSSAPTNPVYLGGDSSSSCGVLGGSSGAASGPVSYGETAPFFNTPSTKYSAMFLNIEATTNMLAYGYEA